MADEKLWHENEGTITLWMPEADQLAIAVLGKLAEECNELAGRAARCIIQGLDAIDPVSGRTNRTELRREMADVMATDMWARETIAREETPDQLARLNRATRKLRGYHTWQNLILKELARQDKA